jgi:predicted NBD/HSP70 family sugar kinase
VAVLGIDIGSARIKAGMVDEQSAIVASRTIETPADLDGFLHFLEGLRMADLVGLPLDVPVFADNDGRLALAAEMVWGAARGHSDVVMLTLGAGVGGAVLANGHLLRGHSGVADASADLLVALQEEVWARSRGLLRREVPLVEQQAADKSGIVGAAGLVMAPRG